MRGDYTKRSEKWNSCRFEKEFESLQVMNLFLMWSIPPKGFAGPIV